MNKCCFKHESKATKKNNSSDSKWLKSALYHGSAHDKTNADVLLVQSNSLSSLTAVEPLNGQTKHTNKSSSHVIDLLSQSFMNSDILLQRDNDWKKVRTDEGLNKNERAKIYTYSYFEKKILDNYIQNLKEQLIEDNKKSKSVSICVSFVSALAGKEDVFVEHFRE